MSAQEAKRTKTEQEDENGAERKSTSPKKTCDLSTQKFADVVDFAAFVDKTLFIKDFLDAEPSVIVALAPRRFGKSTNMDMVREFLTGNKKLFETNKLKIFKEQNDFFTKHCKKNPVIYVDFKSVGGKSEDELLKSMNKVIRCAYSKHQYLVKKVGEKYSWSKEELEGMEFSAEEFVNRWKKFENVHRNDVIDGLYLLSQCLYVYHDKELVYVLIDEYDAPIMKVINNNPGNEVVNETINLISEIMSKFLKNNEYIMKGLINACVRIAQVFSSHANNIIYYDFLREPRFAPYYGFTDGEVADLFERAEFAAFKNDEVKKWYNGYELMHTQEYVIYEGRLKSFRNGQEMARVS